MYVIDWNKLQLNPSKDMIGKPDHYVLEPDEVAAYSHSAADLPKNSWSKRDTPKKVRVQPDKKPVFSTFWTRLLILVASIFDHLITHNHNLDTSFFSTNLLLNVNTLPTSPTSSRKILILGYICTKGFLAKSANFQLLVVYKSLNPILIQETFLVSE